MAERVGIWTLVRTLGEGATSLVHEARSDAGVRGIAKVARVARRAFDEDWVAREAILLARVLPLAGPEIVDAGVEGGRSFFVTRFDEGDTLDRAMEAPRVDRIDLARRVAHGVGLALAELHAARVCHCDVKPANILVTRDGDVRLIDFGLARVAGEDLVGVTPAWAAPEIGSAPVALPAHDLWALGAVLELVLDGASRARRSRRSQDGPGEEAAWARMLRSASPEARPGAAWIATRAARAIERPADPERIVAARRRSIARAYLAVRRGELAVPRPLDDVWKGEPRAWVDRLFSTLRALAVPDRGAPIGALSPFGMSRWMVAVVGPAAAAWPVTARSEEALAIRMIEHARISAPEAWSYADFASEDLPVGARGDGARERGNDEGCARDAASVCRRLLRGDTRESVLLAAEDLRLAHPDDPLLAVVLGEALARRGELGRAVAALEGHASDEALALRAEMDRRRGDVAGAERDARALFDSRDGELRGRARATAARIAWDRGDLALAAREIEGDATAWTAEIRGLVAYGSGAIDAGVEVVRAALFNAHDPGLSARLHGVLGMLHHAAARAEEAVSSFSRAVEISAQAGAILDEATYLTGVAAAASDAGEIGRALDAATRAALIWERLGQPARAARALLSRSCALLTVGASAGAAEAATEAVAFAREGSDRIAEIYARWAVADALPADGARGAEEIAHAEALLRAAGDGALVAAGRRDDGLRQRARLHARASMDDAAIEATDRLVPGARPAARIEWWGARAGVIVSRGVEAGADGAARAVLGEIVRLAREPLPIAVLGPALLAGERLARALGDGESTLFLAGERRQAAARLRRGTPPIHEAALATVPWVNEGKDARVPAGISADQLGQLAAVTRALSGRDRLGPLLQQALDALVFWTGVERGLLLFTAPGDRLVVRAARNLDRRDLSVDQRALSTTIARRALESGRPVVATDALSSLGEYHASVHALRLRSVLAVPLRARGEALGVVYLDDRVRAGAFGPEALAWVELIATQAAMAICDARDQVLLRRAARRAERANARLSTVLAEQERELDRKERELGEIRASPPASTRFRYDEIRGRSEAMLTTLRLVDRVTESDVPVLVLGESGTGKELVARAIHENGKRRARLFLAENCASVPEALLESTLFGHMRGAFTGASQSRAGLFEVADGGTLFLDEIGEMPLAMQAKLLRVLQDGEVRPVGGERARKVNVRVIAATHRDLAQRVREGAFREDLFYRLDVVTVRVPALRERRADIPELVQHFVEKHRARDRPRPKITREAMDRLAAFAWPGNVRQLENELRRALVLADGAIDVSELSPEVSAARGATEKGADTLRARVDALEEELVREAMRKARGNQTRAAEALGLSRFGLQKMMKRLGIRP